MAVPRAGGKSATAFRTISEVSEELEVPQHVLRFWETKFTLLRPLKRAGGRRYYRPEDIDLLRRIRSLLYKDGYTIKGVQKVLREKGVKAVGALALIDETPATPTIVADASSPASPATGGSKADAGMDKATRKKLEELLADMQGIKAQLDNK